MSKNSNENDTPHLSHKDMQAILTTLVEDVANNKKVDLRVQRSRQSLQAALFSLIGKKSYENIKISEITDLAGVSRPTFYLHYKNKDELLVYSIDELLDEMLQAFYVFPTILPDALGGIATFMFHYWATHAEKLGEIIRIGKGYLIYDRIQSITEKLAEGISLSGVSSASPVVLRYAGGMYAGSMYELLIRWFKEGMPQSPEEMGQFYYEIMYAGFERILAGEIDHTLEP